MPEEPKPTVTARLTKRTVEFDLDNAPLVEMQFFVPILADKVTIDYVPYVDGGWRASWFKLSGWRSKKDGNRGNSLASTFGYASDIQALPLWLRNIIDENTPEGKQ